MKVFYVVDRLANSDELKSLFYNLGNKLTNLILVPDLIEAFKNVDFEKDAPPNLKAQANA